MSDDKRDKSEIGTNSQQPGAGSVEKSQQPGGGTSYSQQPGSTDETVFQVRPAPAKPTSSD